MRTPLSFRISRKVGALSQRDMVGREHRSSPVSGKRPQGEVLAQMIEIVRIFITAGDGEMRVRKLLPSAWVISNRLRGSAMTAASLSANPRRRSACPSNTTPATDVMRPPSKAALIFLRSTAGNEKGRRRSSVMAGVAWMRLCEGSASATNPSIKEVPTWELSWYIRALVPSNRHSANRILSSDTLPTSVLWHQMSDQISAAQKCVGRTLKL